MIASGYRSGMDGVEVFRLADIAVKHIAADAGDVVSGAPTLGTTAITTLGDSGVEVGVWEMSVGAVRDVEVDEVFLVLAGRGDAVLGRAPLRWLGRVSYSLYLWHWPVLTIAAEAFGPLTGPTRAGLVLLSVVLAIITYALVENPIRGATCRPR